MPCYIYEDEETGFQVEVIRTISDCDVVPSDEELEEAERGKARKWRKVLTAFTATRGPNWRTRKGYH